MASQGSLWPADAVFNFVSLGPTVIDEIHFSDGSTKTDVPGGAGLYGMLHLS